MIYRSILQLILLFLPWSIRRFLLNRLFSFDIHKSARIGLSLVAVENLKMDEGSAIGHLNMIRGLERLSLSCFSTIGNFNWITGRANMGPHFSDQPTRYSSFRLGKHSAITHRHLVDCTDAVEIGKFSTLAGWGSQILTHAIDIGEAKQKCGPVSIGDYCFVGTRCIVLKGAVVPNKTVLAAGSVLSSALSCGHALYGGVPARLIKELDPHSAYFNRSTGFVS